MFDEEFTGATLNPNLWQAGWFGGGVTQPVDPTEQECHDSRQVSVAGGDLRLGLAEGPETCGGRTRPYVSGLVSTNPAALGPGKGFAFTYGFVQARVFVPATSSGQCATWPAIWTDGQTWPTNGEIDIYECLAGQAAWHIHSGSSGGAPAGPGQYPQKAWTGWHTFAADWEPGLVTFYYDGLNVGSHAYQVDSPNYLVLNAAVAAGDKVAGPSTLLVDYVRVWQRATH